jgi:YfiH family protein
MEAVYSKDLQKGRFETWTKKPGMGLLHATQVHGIDIVPPKNLPCEADGIIVLWDDVQSALAIKTADCLPIVIEGERGVVVAHAGWRGLRDGILKQSEIKNIQPQRVFIGPSIHECCFEVSEDFLNHFPRSPFFRKVENKHYFNLQAEAKRILNQNFTSLEVQIAPVCTCCDNSLHSYRRNKTTERNWNIYIKG